MSDHLPYLDTPRLAEVYTFSLKRLEFFYLESVRCIHTFCHSGKLSTFRNLEYLLFTDYNVLDYVHYPHTSNRFEEFSVGALRKLKEIDFFYHYKTDFDVRNLSTFEKIIQTVLKLNRSELKVFWQNVQVTDLNLLFEYANWMANGRRLLPFQLHNYQNLKNEPLFHLEIRFNTLMAKLQETVFNLSSEDFAAKFCAKFSLFRLILIGRVEYPELLMELIARSPNLIVLQFSNSGLEQEFFDRLPEILERNHIPLERLETDQQLSAITISKLFRLPSLTKIAFFSGYFGKRSKVKRMPSNRFCLNGKIFGSHALFEHFEAKHQKSNYNCIQL